MRQIDLLFRIHGPLRSAEFGACPGFHFDENHRFFVPCNYVDFSAARVGAIAPRDDCAAVLPQMAMGKIFSQAPVVMWKLATPQNVRGAIQKPDHFRTSNSNSITLPRTT